MNPTHKIGPIETGSSDTQNKFMPRLGLAKSPKACTGSSNTAKPSISQKYGKSSGTSPVENSFSVKSNTSKRFTSKKLSPRKLNLKGNT